jgi:NADH-quinone oxidoreductase subunit N
MNYGQFLNMVPEYYLVLILLAVFAVDFIMHKSEKKLDTLYIVTVALMAVLPVRIVLLADPAEAFGGLYVATPAVNVMKAILAFGSLIVVLMAQPWLQSQKRLAGEFYMLIISTLLGMFVMMSSANFLLFFLGLEMASVPLACMVAFDRNRKQSAEGAAKYILVATFSSGVMLFGISFIYAATGTLYFADVAAVITAKPLTIMGLVFFFSGLGFKISLVPFHFWTADTYQGAPTPVTGYLSVISKGAAAITLCIILMKVFQPLLAYWEYLLYIVIVLSITVANLFAIRQSELKRFMAFSSISQAGYIMLAVVGNGQMGIAALTYYVLVYIVANMAVFTVINVVERNNGGRTDMAAYNGFYQTNPKLSFLLTLALFSLAGIPPFAGMFSKFFVFMAAAEQGSAAAYFVVFIALVNTVVSLYYYLLIVKAMYITKTDSPLPTFQSDVNTKIAMTICTAGVALFGVCSCIYEWIAAAGM